MNTVRFWIQNSRSNALPQSLLPAFLAVAMAFRQPDFSMSLSILAIGGVVLGHLGLNLWDDYFDYRRKETAYRDKMARAGIRARIAKCSYLTSGAATIGQLRNACLAFCLLALLIGLILFLSRGIFILYIGLITGFLGLSYSGNPLRLSYRGLGELLVGFMFGPLLMAGVYYSACRQLDLSVILVSIPVGLLVANILYTHSIMDFEPDKSVGKMTLAVLLNNKKAMLLILTVFLFLPFLLIGYGIMAACLPAYYWWVMGVFPMALGLFYFKIKYIKYPTQEIDRYFWMGPMNNWEKIKGTGIEWFMIRWYLARNLLSIFCLVILLLNVIYSV